MINTEFGGLAIQPVDVMLEEHGLCLRKVVGHTLFSRLVFFSYCVEEARSLADDVFVHDTVILTAFTEAYGDAICIRHPVLIVRVIMMEG